MDNIIEKKEFFDIIKEKLLDGDMYLEIDLAKLTKIEIVTILYFCFNSLTNLNLIRGLVRFRKKIYFYKKHDILRYKSSLNEEEYSVASDKILKINKIVSYSDLMSNNFERLKNKSIEEGKCIPLQY